MAVAVGGRGVSVGIGDGSRPGCVDVGLAHAAGKVWVGKMTCFEVTVGLNSAVIVKSGVGKTIGVGDEIKGKLQASEAKINNPSTIMGYRCFLIMLPSLKTI